MCWYAAYGPAAHSFAPIQAQRRIPGGALRRIRRLMRRRMSFLRRWQRVVQLEWVVRREPRIVGMLPLHLAQILGSLVPASLKMPGVRPIGLSPLAGK